MLHTESLRVTSKVCRLAAADATYRSERERAENRCMGGTSLMAAACKVMQSPACPTPLQTLATHIQVRQCDLRE